MIFDGGKKEDTILRCIALDALAVSMAYVSGRKIDIPLPSKGKSLREKRVRLGGDSLQLR